MSLNNRNLSDLEEIDRFEEAITVFNAGGVDPDRFTAIRLQQGVYGQRQQGVNMLRIKVPGGRLNAAQLDVLADIAEEFSQHQIAHVTTRQSIQIHYIPLIKMPSAMRRLAKAGMTTREACGNTIRNMTACPLAGVCPKEHVDVSKHLDGATVHFLRNPLNQQLPRKFKISFSGCEEDCAQSLLHDCGVIAVRKDGQPGFRIRAGGGLGHKPRESIVVDDFIPESDLMFAMEALVTLHNKYSDRTNARSRASSSWSSVSVRKALSRNTAKSSNAPNRLWPINPIRGGMAHTERQRNTGTRRTAQGFCTTPERIVCVSDCAARWRRECDQLRGLSALFKRKD